VIRGSRHYNLEYNSGQVEQPALGEMINGQGLGAVSRLRYGICRMSFNGCEVIAVHNALVYLGKPQPLKDIAFFMERFRVLLGFFGCNVYRVGRALEHYGVAYERTKDVGDAEAFIVSFWTKLPLLSPIHTVFCVRTPDGIKVYNRYNNFSSMSVCKSMQDVAGRHRPLAVYRLKEQESPCPGFLDAACSATELGALDLAADRLG